MPQAASLLHWITKQWDGAELVALSDAWYYPASWLMNYALKPSEDNFYDQLAHQHNTAIKGFQETVQARIATTEERALFKEPGRAPLIVLVIQRQAISANNQVLEVATLTDRASRYVLEYWVPWGGVAGSYPLLHVLPVQGRGKSLRASDAGLRYNKQPVTSYGTGNSTHGCGYVIPFFHDIQQ